MRNRKESLSMLSEMIDMAKADNVVRGSEYSFLLGVANELGVDKATFDSLFNKSVEKTPIRSEEERLLQFHRLLVLMNVDNELHRLEIGRLHVLGLGMGIRPSAILKVISEMDKYPDKIIPSEVLAELLKD